MTWHPELHFGIPAVVGSNKAVAFDTLMNFFPNLITAILEFFRSGQPPIPPVETLEIAALTAAAIWAAGEAKVLI